MPNPVGYGQPVLLTATVTAGATGKVTFYDGTTVLGVAALTGTQATLTTVLLPSGTRSLHARLLGRCQLFPEQLRSGVAIGSRWGSSLGLRHAVNYPAGAYPAALVVGDFNGDGKPDLIVGNYSTSSISVLLGNGDGSFQAPMNSPLGITLGAVAVGDFNGDGKTDLAAASGNVIRILIGNGDGTFQAGVSFTIGSSISVQALVVSDFNGDGKPDLASGTRRATPMR